MSAALETLRAFARSNLPRCTENESNEKNERTPAEKGVNSFNSFFSLSPGADAENFQERAALVEFSAGVPREWAEGFARLSPDRVPTDVPARRWARFIDDVGQFLDGGFAEQSAALGWSPFDLFGADPEKPFARIDRAGLLWLLNGARVVALTESAATVEAVGGVRNTFRRKPTDPGRVLAWNLLHD
jgi:hypothetical protein